MKPTHVIKIFLSETVVSTLFFKDRKNADDSFEEIYRNLNNKKLDYVAIGKHSILNKNRVISLSIEVFNEDKHGIVNISD